MRKKNQNFRLILFLLQIIIISSYITIPFTYSKFSLKDIPNINSITGKELNKYLKTKLQTSISIGTPSKSLISYISMDSFSFYLNKYSCDEEIFSFYEPKNSNSYSNSSFTNYAFRDLRNVTIAQDVYSFYNNLNLTNNISIKDFQFLYGEKFNGNENNSDICGIIGLGIPRLFMHDYKDYYFLKEFNNKKIGNYSFTFDFNVNKNKYDGLLIIGAKNEDYLINYNMTNEELNMRYCASVGRMVDWALRANKIFYEIKNIQNNTISIIDVNDLIFDFNIDTNYIFAGKEFYESVKENFFNFYFEKKICFEVSTYDVQYRYKFIYCDKKLFKDKNNFISLNINERTINFDNTYSMNTSDLFLETNDKYIFLIFYDYYNQDKFILGKTFLKKYHMVFDIDQKKMGFIENDLINKWDNNEEKGKSQNWLIYLILVIVIIVFIGGVGFGIYLGKKYCLNRKKRANELTDDDYEYSAGKEGDGTENKLFN